MMRRMAKLTDDADYDAGETFENVSIPLSDAGNHDNYYGRRLRTRCLLHSLHDNKTKLRQRGQPTSINRKETATTPEVTFAFVNEELSPGGTRRTNMMTSEMLDSQLLPSQLFTEHWSCGRPSAPLSQASLVGQEVVNPLEACQVSSSASRPNQVNGGSWSRSQFGTNASPLADITASTGPHGAGCGCDHGNSEVETKSATEST
ncbi:unnamed protein product [Protopolystoma xenopodis]|uniref:Uncharacterized protein n=1 Tax=Protopolystoma xenopodis TaxID=117903 RepID=A0A448WMA7_9PLAT|nr:unnamed protein product [Protopolystoma xenopodis]